MWTLESLFVAVFIVVTIAGLAAFGPWTRSRKPWD
jgi:hypothetical protein